MNTETLNLTDAPAATAHKILVVDDETANLRLLERLFRRQHQVLCAASGLEAIELLTQHEIAVIISDQRMPVMTGVDFLKHAAQLRPHSVRIILTGYTDVGTLVEAINSGVVYKYVTKPWVNEDLLQTVARALEHYETNKSRHELSWQNARLTAQLEKAQVNLFDLLVDQLAARDNTQFGHQQRVSDYSAAIGRKLGLSKDEIGELQQAALLHNAGQMRPMTADFLGHGDDAEDEAETPARLQTFQQEAAARLLEIVLQQEKAADTVRHFKEKFDGGGLPDNLRGEQIPLFARIIQVADCYDELTENIFAECSLSHDAALTELRRKAGGDFDPDAVQAFGELETIGQIRRLIHADASGMRLQQSKIFGDADDFSVAELLHKFKTEPLLALEVLKAANRQPNHEPTGQLLAAMSRVGEPRLRQIIEEHGWPCFDANLQNRLATATRRAMAAELLAAQTRILPEENAYTLGLVLDAGELLLLSLFPEQMQRFDELPPAERWRRQTESFAVSAVQVTRWMLQACGYPAFLLNCVQSHVSAQHISDPTALLLHIADHIARHDRENIVTAVDDLGPDCLKLLRLSRAELYHIHERINQIHVQDAAFC